MNLVCPKCGHKWNYRGNNYRIDCGNCRKQGIITIIKTGLPTPWEKSNSNPNNPTVKSNSISDSIMRGNILEALEKADIDPMNNNGKISKDFIPLLLKDEKLKFAFAKYCEAKKKQPLWVVKKAIINFLMEEKYYEK